MNSHVLRTFYSCFCILSCSLLLCCNASRNPPVAPTNKDEDSITYIPSHPLQNESDLDVLMNSIGDARVVLLGGSTHGTHEFYEWWTVITKRLIMEKGFTLIAIEGDWDNSYQADRFIKGPKQDSAAVLDLLKQYRRWPPAMWANYETASLLYWLNAYNQNVPARDKVGFYGLDVYDFWQWTGQPLSPQFYSLQNAVNQVRDSFARYDNDAGNYTDYVRATKLDHRATTGNLWNVLQTTKEQRSHDENDFVLEQRALLALEGEHYFRTAAIDRPASWNIRESYMAATIERLLSFYGGKAVVWVHNSHAGDAQYSQMAGADSSIGQILNERMGDNKVFSIGFGTNKGSLLGADHWYGNLQPVQMTAAKPGSWENMLHVSGATDKIILSKELYRNRSLDQWIGFRSIGAVYSGTDFYGTAIIPRRFDAYVYIDSTTAVRPLK